MEVKTYLTESEHLVRKHGTLISAVNKALKESASYSGELDTFKKNSLAIMLESVSQAFDCRAHLFEGTGTQVADIAKKNDYLNLIAAIMPTLTAEELVNVQPLKQKAGVVYYMKHVYDDNKGGISKGDVITQASRVGVENNKFNASTKFSSEEIVDESVVVSSHAFTLDWKPVQPGTFVCYNGATKITDDGEGALSDGGTIDYATGSVTVASTTTVKDNLVSYQTDLYNAPMSVPRVRTVIDEVTVTARPRKLGTAFSMDAAFDLQMTQNIDLQSIIQGAATDEIRSEIDGEILIDLANSGTSMTISWNQPTPFGISKRDHYASFYNCLVEGANKIYNKTRKVTGNFVIAGENASNVIQTLDNFKAAASLNEVGPHIAGNLNGQFIVVKNPYYGSNDFVIGYKGTTPFEGGYVYCPYMAITPTQFIMDDSFQGRQGYATSYAKKLLFSDFYVNGTITQES